MTRTAPSLSPSSPNCFQASNIYPCPCPLPCPCLCPPCLCLLLPLTSASPKVVDLQVLDLPLQAIHNTLHPLSPKGPLPFQSPFQGHCRNWLIHLTSCMNYLTKSSNSFHLGCGGRYILSHPGIPH